MTPSAPNSKETAMTSLTGNPDRTTAPCEVSHLLRREIQAPIAAALIREFARTIGEDRALEIAAAAVSADAEAAGREAAARLGGGSLAGLERLVREVWSARDATWLLPVLQPRRALRPRLQPTPEAGAHPHHHAGGVELRFPLQHGLS